MSRAEARRWYHAALENFIKDVGPGWTLEMVKLIRLWYMVRARRARRRASRRSD